MVAETYFLGCVHNDWLRIEKLLFHLVHSKSTGGGVRGASETCLTGTPCSFPAFWHTHPDGESNIRAGILEKGGVVLTCFQLWMELPDLQSIYT